MEPETKMDEFKEKLKELMEEYRAEISIEWTGWQNQLQLTVDGVDENFYVINDLTL